MTDFLTTLGSLEQAYKHGREDALREAAERVKDSFGQFHPMCAVEDEPTRHDVVSRKAVLRILDAEALVLVRKDSGGVFPDGTTNHPPIDFSGEPEITEAEPNIGDGS